MKVVDFHKLPRAIQDRFVGSVMSGFPPAPIASAKGTTPAKLLWIGASLASLVALVVVARVGFGALGSALSFHSASFIPVYVALVFGVAAGLALAYARLVRERARPYTPGVYLFPACLIDARDDQFRVYDTRALVGVEAAGASLRVTFQGGGRFVFPLARPAAGAALAEEVRAAQVRAAHAHAAGDPKELVTLDPLHNPRFSSPVGPREPYAQRRPVWGKLGLGVAGVVAVVLGVTLFFVRNGASDKNMYARATKANTVAAYRLYLDRGRAFRDEVGDLLLPLAELRDAEAAGTVEALLAYKEAHPGSKIDDQIERALRAGMLVELEAAKAPGTLAALQAFTARFPDHGVGPELASAVRAIYARDLAAYERRAPGRDKDAAAAVARLFAWAEAHGPAVEVRFRRRTSPSLERADRTISKTPTFMGLVTYPSRFFDDARAAKREAALGEPLAAALEAGLSPELFDVTLGSAVEGEALPAPKVPTLFITHTAEWSGHTYATTRPRGSYIGVLFRFEAELVIPGEPSAYAYKVGLFRPAATNVLKEAPEPLDPGFAEEKVYETMAETAFDTFGKRLLAAFVAPAN